MLLVYPGSSHVQQSGDVGALNLVSTEVDMKVEVTAEELYRGEAELKGGSCSLKRRTWTQSHS